MPTYFITGANRGLGLEFVRQLSEDKAAKNTILATTRDPSGEASQDLKKLADASSGSVHVIKLDIGSEESIEAVKGEVEGVVGKDGGIDYLLNNAGINATPSETSLTMTKASVHNHMDINVLAPSKIVSTLLPHLKKGSVIMNMTSGLGSAGKTINAIKESKCATYAISKAAVCMLTVHQAFALKDRGIRVITIDPGWVKTRMGGEGAVLEPHESISGMLKVIHGLGENDTAKAYEHSGEEMPW